MIPFHVQFRPGGALYEQVVYAAKKAMMSGQLRPGDTFPSVRALSKELKINPNTAHKVVAQLVNAGLLEIRPGIGTIVAARPESSKKERANLVEGEIEELVVEAKRLRLGVEDVTRAIEDHWKRLSDKDANVDSSGRGGQSKR